ncbi:KGGVGR-motif variant AAA ATPase [Roseateles sp. MS654]|uniref:KGGVGR-motif variant AAA ATPase n=1 Tax=Roseateles sp. MS654 TaxID=3412685 RepID=UPI003C2D1FA5
MTQIHFNDAIVLAARCLQSLDVSGHPKPRLIRDVFGRLRFAINTEAAVYPDTALRILKETQTKLGAFATSDEILTRDSFTFPDKVFNDADWHRTRVDLGYDDDGENLGEIVIDLLDRQITGQDWLRPAQERSQTRRAHRFVFFGLKGGVGRSTALCMTAWGLARAGKRVLLIDLDLESPGLSSLVLPQERMADFGVIDWLVEDAVGQGNAILPRMVAASPLGESTVDAVRVASAIGNGEIDYIAKLARAYADVPTAEGPKRLGQRLKRLIELLGKVCKTRSATHEESAFASYPSICVGVGS